MDNRDQAHNKESTSSEKKIWVYLDGLSEDPKFQKKIRLIRKEIGLPDNGLKDLLYSDDKKYLRRPKEFSDEGTEQFRKTIDKLIKTYKIPPLWEEIIIYYISYNIWIDIDTKIGLIELEDLYQTLIGPHQYDGDKETGVHILSELSKDLPVSILISPYATQRDIIDFVKKMYKTEIKPMQEFYRNPDIKIGTMRTRNKYIKERNAFIYKNKETPTKELITKIYDAFGEFMDYTYVNEIIKKEKNKRK